jgi:prevent-host-death family protein
MGRASITEAKNGLSALIDRVRAGETIVILDRGIPVARLEPVISGSDPTGRVERLSRAGVLQTGKAPPPLDLLREPGPPLARGASAVATVLQERDETR